MRFTNPANKHKLVWASAQNALKPVSQCPCFAQQRGVGGKRNLASAVLGKRQDREPRLHDKA